eukprot:g336.t1
MEIHHSKHHNGYTTKLNAAIEGTELEDMKIEEILMHISKHSSGVRNNGGGYYNHKLFWEVMSPDGGGEPSERMNIHKAIMRDFGSFENFKDEFAKAAATRFGSGWAWLCVSGSDHLFVTSTPNQDNPLMDVVEQQGTPILGLDVWEHAYYLNYQNRRPDYIEAFFNVNVSGVVTDDNSGEELIGATVIIKGTTTGVVTDYDGSFLLATDTPPPFVIVVSYTGYEPQEITINGSDDKVKVRLGSAATLIDVVEVKGQRIDEQRKASALTVESLDPIGIKQTASENFYDGLGALKGIDLTSASLGIKYFWLDVGPAIFAGSVNGFDSLLTVESFEDFALNLDEEKLNYFNVDPIRPERVRTIEAGYRSILGENLYVDASYYYNIYNDFIGFRVGLDVEFTELNLPSDVQAYRVSANAEDQVTTQGFAIGLNYYFKKFYQISGNYTWSKLNTQTDDEIIPAFNTPEHKFNLSLSGRDIPIRIGNFSSDNFGFNINYKWVESFLFEGSPQFTGTVPGYGLLDVQANYEFEKINTTLKVGASNILENLHFETVGGPQVGRLAYLKLTYQFDKK